MKFQPGNEYGKQGRPKGARNKLASSVYTDVLEFLTEPAAFQASEPTKFRALLLTLWREAPRDLGRFIASILPKELSIETSTVTELSDEELDRLIFELRARALAVREEQSLDDDAAELKLLPHACVEDGMVKVTDLQGHLLGTQPIRPGDDIEAAARKILRGRAGSTASFTPPSHIPRLRCIRKAPPLTAPPSSRVLAQPRSAPSAIATAGRNTRKTRT
jgi:hypothetical protein